MKEKTSQWRASRASGWGEIPDRHYLLQLYIWRECIANMPPPCRAGRRRRRRSKHRFRSLQNSTFPFCRDDLTRLRRGIAFASPLVLTIASMLRSASPLVSLSTLFFDFLFASIPCIERERRPTKGHYHHSQLGNIKERTARVKKKKRDGMMATGTETCSHPMKPRKQKGTWATRVLVVFVFVCDTI